MKKGIDFAVFTAQTPMVASHFPTETFEVLQTNPDHDPAPLTNT